MSAAYFSAGFLTVLLAENLGRYLLHMDMFDSMLLGVVGFFFIWMMGVLYTYKTVYCTVDDPLHSA